MTQVPQPHQNRTAPPGFIYTAVGKLVPVIAPFGEKPVSRKLLVVLPYYDGDKSTAEDLIRLICDLERVRVKEADFMVMQRADAHPMDTAILQRLGEKFEKVHQHTCRRRDGVGHPFGANQMFFDVLTLLGQIQTWSSAYYAFLFMEPDCTPLRPGWIGELAAAFRDAEANRGKSAIGFVHDNPRPHLNGVAVYATDIYRKAAGDRLGGGNAQAAFDIEKGPIILPMAEDCALFNFQYRRPTITSAELFAPRKNGVVPALWHGVKDASAREAVRARFVTFAEKSTSVRPTVYTFYQPVEPGQDPENQSILRLWTQAWKARGFNPVVLRGIDAAKNAHYVGFSSAIGKFPTVLNKQTQVNRFLRWLALDSVGGGILVEYDVLPSQITPDKLTGMTGFHLARPREVQNLAAAVVDKLSLAKWLDQIQNYEPQPDDLVGDRKSVSDINVMRHFASTAGVAPEDWIKNFGDPNWADAPMVHFTSGAIQRSGSRGDRKSALMERLLRGDVEWLMAKAEPAPEPMAAIKVDAPEEDQKPEEPADADARLEMFNENETLRAENEKLKVAQKDQEDRMAEMERRIEAMTTPKYGTDNPQPVDPPKRKAGRPKKIQPQPAAAP